VKVTEYTASFQYSRSVARMDIISISYKVKVKVKVKVKFTPEQATKAQRGSRGIALLFL